MRVAAVIGSPVGASLSPAMHQAVFDAAGIDWRYVAFEVAPGAAAAALTAMRTLGLAGLSVTTPHKEDVAAAVDVLDPAAAGLASVNTVAVDGDGRLVGYSTDGDGFVASLASEGVAVAGATVAVLGAGGAARSIVDALGRHGATDVIVVNRTPDRAEAAAALAPAGRVGAPDDVAAADVVVNTTTVGMGAPTDSGILPIDQALLRRSQVVVDIITNPLRTPLLAAAEAAGARTIDGLGMLVHQAVLQQRIWRGPAAVPADAATIMRTAAEAELTRRAR